MTRRYRPPRVWPMATRVPSWPGRERVPKGVAAGPLRQAGPADRGRHCPLHRAGMAMMTTPLATHPITIDPRRRKHPLPGPLGRGARILGSQGARELDPPRATREIAPVKPPHQAQVLTERTDRGPRKNGHSVLLALPAPDPDLTPLQIEILDPQRNRLPNPQPATIQEHGDQPGYAAELAQHARHLAPGQHHRQPARRRRSDQPAQVAERTREYLPVQEQQGRQRLGLGRERPARSAGYSDPGGAWIAVAAAVSDWTANGRRTPTTSPAGCRLNGSPGPLSSTNHHGTRGGRKTRRAGARRPSTRPTHRRCRSSSSRSYAA